MAMLAEVVEVVIGVDTHKHPHTAAVVVVATDATTATMTVAATPAGYQQLLELADQHHDQRVWAIEGTGGYGAGLTRFLTAHHEQVVELDRPKRPADGTAPTPIPSMPAGPPAKPWAATSPPNHEPPGPGRRCRCGWPLDARPSRPPATPSANSTPWSSPPPRVLRERLHASRSTGQLVAACARLRVHTDWDVETATTAATYAAWPVGSGN